MRSNQPIELDEIVVNAVDGQCSRHLKPSLEQFREKCLRFSVRKLRKNKKIERFAVSVKR
jgi:hypothetical protein